MAKRKPVVKRLQKHLWELTSKYVRLHASNWNGDCSCVTCGLTKPWKEMQAGHFIPRAQGNSTKWDLRNIHPQCYRCNINLGGNGAEYYPFMVKTYGEKVVTELRQLSNQSRKITLGEYQTMIDEMAERISKLIMERQRSNYWTHWALQNVS